MYGIRSASETLDRLERAVGQGGKQWSNGAKTPPRSGQGRSACGGPGANDEAVTEERTEPRPAAAAALRAAAANMRRAGEYLHGIRVMASTVITAHAAGTSAPSTAQLFVWHRPSLRQPFDRPDRRQPPALTK